ncbi:MAG: caspase family protein [Winogradskyella sp.]|uniref:caspase family protein n=1 Tax=Winogradskyella sp. TaxID=1883156 RepID=UPI0025FD7235|nr:caspase family protein [Winogradskyella sp.]NRB61096.1 caspase family protein [Winogradskyella sp.]
MRFLCFILLSIPTLLYSNIADDGGKRGPRKKNPINIHVISVGINNITTFGNTPIGNVVLENCINDAKTLIQKMEKDVDKIDFKDTYDSSRGPSQIKRDTTQTIKPKIFSYLLLEEQATAANIRKALKEVVKNSTSKDYFVFYFGGLSIENKANETFLVPRIQIEKGGKINIVKEQSKYDLISLKELATFMNQIPAQNQMVISEAGNGRVFAQNLQAELFELDPVLALNTDRNRIILTSVGLGFDKSKCDPNHAPLMKYILEAGNIYNVFENFYHYEYLLNKVEIRCNLFNTKYFYLSQEKDYKKLLQKRVVISNSRGAKGKKVKSKQTENIESTTHALIIATNAYNREQVSWDNLKNPLNDANSVSELLEQKYNVKVTKLYNEPRQEIIKGIIRLKEKVDKNDKLIVFIAGHGHYSELFSQGYIVPTDCKSLDEDTTFDSYIPMSTLNLLFDSFRSKPIFTVLDVCYGASFEMNEADLMIENYVNAEFDKGIENYIAETDKSFSRIILASGKQEVPDFWNNSLDHSPFANKFIKALENEKEFISPGKIIQYLRGNATRPILKKFGKHEVTGDFLLQVLN